MYNLYILKCADKSLYTGITTDLKRRVGEHNSSKLGARYTASRRPVKLVYSKKFKNRSLASIAEAKIKKLSRSAKLALLKISSSKKLRK
jgi:putative endonuclease